MDLTIASTLRLNDGVAIPRFGLGVYRTPSGATTVKAVLAAIEAGYRYVDTAALYKNEESVGEAVRQSGLPREEVFVSTKLWNADHGYEEARRACRESVDRLGLDYIDLYLIHWPVPEGRRDSWRALEELKEEGLCRSIGVSNYTIRHMTEILNTGRTPPSVNQVEFSPFLYQRDLLAFCHGRGVRIEAYSPLTKGRRLDDPVLIRIGSETGRTPAQVLIRWALQHDLVVIPKSQDPGRICENAEAFEFALSAEQMTHLDGLDEGYHTSWDPSDER